MKRIKRFFITTLLFLIMISLFGCHKKEEFYCNGEKIEIKDEEDTVKINTKTKEESIIRIENATFKKDAFSDLSSEDLGIKYNSDKKVFEIFPKKTGTYTFKINTEKNIYSIEVKVERSLLDEKLASLEEIAKKLAKYEGLIANLDDEKFPFTKEINNLIASFKPLKDKFKKDDGETSFFDKGEVDEKDRTFNKLADLQKAMRSLPPSKSGIINKDIYKPDENEVHKKIGEKGDLLRELWSFCYYKFLIFFHELNSSKIEESKRIDTIVKKRFNDKYYRNLENLKNVILGIKYNYNQYKNDLETFTSSKEFLGQYNKEKTKYDNKEKYFLEEMDTLINNELDKIASNQVEKNTNVLEEYLDLYHRFNVIDVSERNNLGIKTFKELSDEIKKQIPQKLLDFVKNFLEFYDLIYDNVKIYREKMGSRFIWQEIRNGHQKMFRYEAKKEGESDEDYKKRASNSAKEVIKKLNNYIDENKVIIDETPELFLDVLKKLDIISSREKNGEDYIYKLIEEYKSQIKIIKDFKESNK